jgi:hypothetical protein
MNFFVLVWPCMATWWNKSLIKYNVPCDRNTLTETALTLNLGANFFLAVYYVKIRGWETYISILLYLRMTREKFAPRLRVKAVSVKVFRSQGTLYFIRDLFHQVAIHGHTSTKKFIIQVVYRSPLSNLQILSVKKHQHQ